MKVNGRFGNKTMQFVTWSGYFEKLILQLSSKIKAAKEKSIKRTTADAQRKISSFKKITFKNIVPPDGALRKENKRDSIFYRGQKSILPIKKLCFLFLRRLTRGGARHAARLKNIMRSGMLGRREICVIVIRAIRKLLRGDNAWLHVNADPSRGCNTPRRLCRYAFGLHTHGGEGREENVNDCANTADAPGGATMR